MDWQCDNSCMTDSDDGLENWQNRIYELHGHRCARITKSIRWLGAQVRVLPNSDDLSDPKQFIEQFLDQIPDPQKRETLDLVFRPTVARWRDNHKKYIPSWKSCQKSLHLRFVDQFQEVHSRFDG